MLKKALQLILVLICGWFIYHYFTTHTQEWETLRKLDLTSTILICAGVMAIIVFNAAKFFVILRAMQVKGLRFGEWLSIFIIANFLNRHVTQGANIYRLIQLKKRYNFSLTNSLGITLYGIWLQTLIILAFCIFSALGLTRSPQAGNPSILVILIFSLAILAIGPFLFNAFLPFLRKRFRRIPRILEWGVEKVHNMMDTFFLVSRHKAVMFKFFLLTAAVFLVFLGVILIAFSAIDIRLDLFQASLFTLIFLLSRSFNIVPENIGITEVICGYFSDYIGLSIGQGIIVSGLLRILAYITTLILFLTTLFTEKMKKTVQPNT